MLRCGLVILNYIDFAATIELIDIVKNFDSLEHIVVVDNNSPNNSYDILLQHKSEKVTVINSGKNGGYSYGNNIGIKYLIEKFDVDIIGISNPDVRFNDEFVTRILELFEINPDYAVITGVQVKDGKIAKNAFGGKSSPLGMLKSELAILTRLPAQKCYVYEKLKTQEELIQVWVVMGCLFFMRSSDFQAINFFDDKIFMYMEEEILSSKLEKLGRKVGIASKLRFTHCGGSSYGLLPKLKSLWSFKNSRIYYFKEYMSKNIFLRGINFCLAWLIFVLQCVKAVLNYIMKK